MNSIFICKYIHNNKTRIHNKQIDLNSICTCFNLILKTKSTHTLVHTHTHTQMNVLIIKCYMFIHNLWKDIITTPEYYQQLDHHHTTSQLTTISAYQNTHTRLPPQYSIVHIIDSHWKYIYSTSLEIIAIYINEWLKWKIKFVLYWKLFCRVCVRVCVIGKWYIGVNHIIITSNNNHPIASVFTSLTNWFICFIYFIIGYKMMLLSNNIMIMVVVVVVGMPLHGVGYSG